MSDQNLESEFFACECHPQHFDCNHDFITRICAYPDCACEGFKQVSFSLEIKITKADLFEYETKISDSRYSLEWYSQFELWLSKGENNNVSVVERDIFEFGNWSIFPGI